MIILDNMEQCSGCHGCYNICSKNAIMMKENEEGFKYPVIDEALCINCGLCKKVCPTNNIEIKKSFKAYACKNKKLEQRLNSSSGGIFYLLIQYVIKQNGVVFGAKFNGNIEVEHNFGETLEACIDFRGSKYVQSNINNAYKEAKEFLDKGKLVLFSGTPCQIHGLKAYLMKDYDNLIAVDLACHGSPSPLIFKKYKEFLENKYEDKLESVLFRDKSNGWKSYQIKLKFTTKEILENSVDNIYMKGFLKDIFLRKSCYSCKFKKPITKADLTLADYWGVQNIHKELDDDKGISLVITSSKKGESLLNLISKDVEIIETDLEYAVKYNPCIVRPVVLNKKRKKFFKELDSITIDKLIEKYTKVTLHQRVKGKISSVIRKVIEAK